MRVAILAIGSEITDGQVLNRNAQWLAIRLGEMNFQVSMHESVPDQHDLIVSALDHCAVHCDVVITTGGLGPTKDDFTRNTIAKWLGVELVYNEQQWNSVVERLNSIGAPVAEANRSQCYYPQGSSILENPAGTANGFVAQKSEKPLIVLPGPPREIAAIWEAGLKTRLEKISPKRSHTTLHRWLCLGLSEARLGEIVEEALTDSGFITGYRPHIPYVEVKVWSEGDPTTWFEKLENAIKPWLVGRNDDDVAREFLEKFCRDKRLTILDRATYGMLPQRLWEASSPEILTPTVISCLDTDCTELPTPDITINPLDHEEQWEVEAFGETLSLKYPYKSQQQTALRQRKFLCEASLNALVKKEKGVSPL